MEIHHEVEKRGQIPLDDISAIIISVQGCSLSTNLLDDLAHRNVPIVICGKNYLPSSWTLPITGHNRQFQIMRAQIKLSEPKRKRAWKILVQAKISNQAAVLERVGHSNMRLRRLVQQVRSGDPDNCEAQAARIYWRRLFGNDFRRNREAADLNTVLNYSYTIIRSAIARAVSGAGLHPSFSLHHKNPQNPLNLVDDLIEPFRPIADLLLWSKYREGISELTPDIKSTLVALLTLLLPIDNETSPLSLVAVKMARSVAHYYLNETNNLILPALPTPLDISAL